MEVLPKEFSASTTTETLIKYIVVDKLGCVDAPYAKWVEKLNTNLITNMGLLCRLSPQRLEKLELPLLLEEELIHIIHNSRGTVPVTPLAVLKSDDKTTKISAKRKNADHRSAFLGLTEKERQMILDSWNNLLETQGNNLPNVFDKFYQIFFQLDKTARRLFQGRSLEKQSRALMKVIRMIMSTLEDPTTMLPYVQRLGTRHLIYGVTQKDFQSWAIAFTQTLSEFIPTVMTPHLKEAWFVLIIKLGQTMTESYDEHIQGLKCHLGRTNDKDKKKLYCLLTHQSLAIYKDVELTKHMTTIWIKWITDIDVIKDVKHTKYFPFCFAITLGDIVFYYGVEKQEDCNWWMSEISERVAAHCRIQSDEDSESSSSQQSQQKENFKLKYLKKKLKNYKI